jgi:hypothetical protein
MVILEPFAPPAINNSGYFLHFLDHQCLLSHFGHRQLLGIYTADAQEPAGAYISKETGEL